MNTFDLSPLYRTTVGFDRLASMLSSANRSDSGNAYPPYNIETRGDDDYRITMAVAGFAREDLDITVEEQKLVVSGRKEGSDDRDESNFLHRGIANRAFERRFQLADHVRVTGAELINGLLHIDLQREIPEAMKPRSIEIGTGSSERLLEGKAADDERQAA